MKTLEANKTKDVIWTDEVTGFLCLIIKHPSLGHLCGYVGFTRNHPWAGKNYSDCTLPTARVRGRKKEDYESLMGMKFSERYIEKLSKRLICDKEYCEHTPESIIDVHGGITFAGEWPRHGGSDIWWFGFDCGHFGDFSPGVSYSHSDDIYRDEDYVRDECRKMALQFASIMGA